MVSTILREQDPHQFFPFEWTPLYVGTPSLHETTGSDLPLLGGGYIEPLGFNSPPPANATPRSNTVKAMPEWVVPLPAWTGVASGWMSQNSKPKWEVMKTLLAQNMFEYWNLWDFKGGKTKFVDGGATDLEALMPLLRRGVRNIVLCIPIWVEPTVPIEEWARGE